jgi:hypothetical protein
MDFSLISVIVLTSILAASILVRRSVPKLFSEKNIGEGSYRVLNITPGSGKSVVVTLQNKKKLEDLKSFYAIPDKDGDLKIKALTDPKVKYIETELITLKSGLDLSILRTDENEGHGLVYAKW